MAVKKKAAEPKKAPRKKAESEPRFPYTTKPASLRKLLQEIPKKPKPPKYDRELLQGWGFKDANDHSMIRVLKAIGMLSSTNEPTDIYTQFMHLQSGATALAPKLKEVYEPLFHASHEPWKESPENLQNLFHIHSGGGERCIEQQIQTFKALAENTSFEGGAEPVAPVINSQGLMGGAAPQNPAMGGVVSPNASAGININVHIHLPENKSRRDYECMIEDIGRYIFGREPRGNKDER